MKVATVKPLDVAVAALSGGLLLGAVSRAIENARLLTGLFGG